MNWYLVKMVFQIICGNGKHTAQFEEQLRLIHAADTIAAVNKATLLGKQEEQAFFNHAQQTVCWKLIAVTDIYPFTTELDGAEIFHASVKRNNLHRSSIPCSCVQPTPPNDLPVLINLKQL